MSVIVLIMLMQWDYIPVRSERLSKMRKATQDDDVLQMLITVVQEGWPDEKTLLPPQVMPYSYFHCRDEIVVNDGLVFKRKSCHCSRKYTERDKRSFTYSSYRSRKYTTQSS